VGPSGCGKTTTLKMVNRLVRPEAGRVLIDGADVSSLDPVALRRRTGYVIQHGGLFPHLTVGDNVGTVPRLLGWDKRRRRARTAEVLALVGLDPSQFEDRFPHQLSGGQRQRVGVARALAADPAVLLMDEPFSAVDPIARDRLQEEFLRLQAELAKTVLFVTHDVAEAIRIGGRIAVFRQGGVIEQHDTPSHILAHPANEFVAAFIGSDRNLKRLDLLDIDPALLAPVTLSGAEPEASLAMGASLKDGLEALLASHSGTVTVSDESGRPVGLLDFEAIRKGLSD
jgi:osmoprotectant transport system ATP-binding protein